MLQAAATGHVPVNPSQKYPRFSDPDDPDTVPDAEARRSIDEIISEMKQKPWYDDQIVARRVFEARDGQIG